jgi:Secretion system C-terminal sorting domain
MKRFLLVALLGVICYSTFATTWKTTTAGAINTLANWRDSATGAITPTTFGTAGDTWRIQSNMTIGAVTWTVAGNVIATAGHLSTTTAGDGTVNIGGSLSMSGTVYFGATSTTATDGSLYVNISGNLSMSGTSRFVNLPAFNYVNFVNTSSSLASPQYISYTSTSTAGNWTYYTVNSGVVAQLTSNFVMNGSTSTTYAAFNGQFNLNGTLVCGTYTITDDASSSFTMGSAATIYTANTGGLASTGATGTVRTGTRTYTGNSNYIYNGTSAQITGTGLPTTLTTPASVTINNSAGVTLSQTTTFDTLTTLNLQNGTFTNTAANLVFHHKTNVNRDNGALAVTPTTYSGIYLTYTNLGYNQTALTTGNEFPATFYGNVTVNHTGATITLNGNKTLPTLATFGNIKLTSGFLDASSSNYNISLTANWTNNDSIAAFVPRGGLVTFNGTAAQTLGGTAATVFNSLTLNNSAGLVLADSEFVNGTLTLNTGLLYINTNNLVMGASAAAVAGTPSATNMVIATGTGQMRKTYSATGSFLFPVGDSSANYTPITLNFTSGTFGSNAYAGVNLKKAKHPNNANITDYLNRYWKVRSSGISAATFDVTANYVTADVAGTEGNVSMGQYPLALPWAKYSAANTTTHSLTGSGVANPNSDFSGISTASPTVTVSPTSSLICSGGTVSISASGTRDTPLTYSWSPATGLSVATGTSVIASPTVTTVYTLTLTDGNGFAVVAYDTVNVGSAPSSAVITGASTVCVGASTSLSDTAAGGSWSSSNTAIATVDASGNVYGVSTGTVTISYTTVLTCGSLYALKAMTVNTIPSAGAITGIDNVCISSTTTLTDTVPSGTWSAYNSNASVSGGVVTGLAAGTDTIYYTVSNLCGTSVADAVVTVNTAPSTGVITGIDSMCVGATQTVTESVSGGTWSSGSPSVATITSTGIVTAVGSGITTISYTNIFSCGTAVTTFNITVNPLPAAGSISGVLTLCPGASNTLTDTAIGGTWSVSNSNASIASGVATGIVAGTDSVIYTVTNSCGTATANAILTINPSAVSGTISGTDSLCTSTTVTLATSGTGGAWTSSNSSIATVDASGIVYGTTSGIDTISYTVTTTCGTSVSAFPITVNTAPSVGAITGTAAMCTGATSTLANAVAGGTWSASNGNATVVAGVVSGISAGVDTIYYTLTTSCGSAVAAQAVTINSVPVGGTISGTATVCIGSTDTLTETVSGGSWISTAPGIATISSSGVVTGVATGTSVISYTVIFSCGTAVTTFGISVSPLPTADTITGSSTFCNGTTVTLTDIVSGGSWSAANSNATVAAGVVTATHAGTDIISYSVTTSCGTAVAIHPVTITPLPDAGSLSGALTVCVGAADTFNSAVVGGTWSTSNALVGTIDGSGILTGVSSGSVVVSYSYTNSCGTDIRTDTVTVNPLPDAGVLSGSSFICVGTPDTLTASVSGGSWSASNAGATVASGIVSGVTAGTDTILYTVTNGCGTANTWIAVTVNTVPVAGTITGSNTVCVAATDTLVDLVSFGSWTSSNTAAATVSSTGVVYGVASGTTVITYTSVYSCGTVYATYGVTVNPLPDAGTLTGNNSICVGTPDTLTASVSGGSWAATNGLASVSGGIVSGGTPGVDTIIYSVSNSCGTATTSFVVTVNTVPTAGTISGASILCVGANDTLSDLVTGGTWSSGNASIATVTSGGVVYGAGAGAVTITYTDIYSCGTAFTTYDLTVNPLPFAGTLTGASSVCMGSTDTLSASVPGGSWTTTNASVTVSSGVVSPVSAGMDTIIYTVSNSCGTAATTFAVVVNVLPYAGVISGDSVVCAASNITLSDSLAIGTWSSSDTTVAVVSGGVVTGVAAGIITVSYAASTTCGTAVALRSITVNPLAVAGTISGSATVCVGATSSLTVTSPGGSWTSGTVSVATISSGGVVSGVASGTDVITYTVTNSCNTATVTDTITVNPVPAGITGTTSLCAGLSTILHDATAGGSWSSSAPGVAAIGASTGSVFAVVTYSSASATITYTLPSGCFVTTGVSISPLPNAGTVTTATGSDTVCVGGTLTMLDTSVGGTPSWLVTNSHATISSSGVVTGVSTGFDTVVYTLTTCNSSNARAFIYVKAVADTGHITGSDSICAGATTILSETVGGGVWTSGDTTKASVSATGSVHGIGSGVVPISYAVHNSCGTRYAIRNMVVHSVPDASAITGASSVCPTAVITLMDSTSGGIWMVRNTHASISSTGVLTGNTPGTDSVLYVVHNSCGYDTVKKLVTIDSFANPGTITSLTMSDTVCANSGTLALSNWAAGGTWTMTNSVLATIDSTGLITGHDAGLDSVVYSVSNVCGVRNITYAIDVKPLPNAGIISGTVNTVCAGSSITFTESVSGGAWSLSNTTFATVLNGVVTGVAAGSDTIIYAATNSCGTVAAILPMTINPLANAGIISGSSNICVAGTATFTDPAVGGTWMLNSGANASIAGGVVSGIAVGSDSVLYVVGNMCNTDTARLAITVLTTPVAATVTGGDSVCNGASLALSAGTPGGVWTSSNTAINTVSISGSVTALSAGTDTVYYTLSNVCGSTATPHIVMVQEMPSFTITGFNFVCLGSRDNYDTLSVSGTYYGTGNWTASNSNASVTPNGIVQALVEGFDTVTYTVTNSCGTQSSSRTIFIATPWQCDSLLSTPNVALTAETVNVYPNPTSGTFTIEVPRNVVGFEVFVMDMMGRTVAARSIEAGSGNTAIFDISQVAGGPYFIKVTANGADFIQKLEKY